MRIGILGGSFDPVHVGHLLVARDAMEKLKLDRVLFLIAARPPHKHCTLAYEARRDLLRRAIRVHAGFVLCEIEARRSGPSYTIESLAVIRKQFPRDRLLLLLGADQFREMKAWRQPEHLSDYAEVVVMTRPGATTGRPLIRARKLPVRQVNISSSEIRSRIARNLSVADMVPDPVLKMIVKNRLYVKKGKK